VFIQNEKAIEFKVNKRKEANVEYNIALNVMCVDGYSSCRLKTYPLFARSYKIQWKFNNSGSFISKKGIFLQLQSVALIKQ